MKALSKTDTVIRLGRINKQITAELNKRPVANKQFDIKLVKVLAKLQKRVANLHQIINRDSSMYVDSNGHLKRMS